MEALLLDRSLCKRFHVESLIRNRKPALDRSAVAAIRDALLGSPHGGQLSAEAGSHGEVDGLRLQPAGAFFELAGLLTSKRSGRAYVAVQPRQRCLDAGSLTSDVVTCVCFVHDRLLVGPRAACPLRPCADGPVWRLIPAARSETVIIHPARGRTTGRSGRCLLLRLRVGEGAQVLAALRGILLGHGLLACGEGAQVLAALLGILLGRGLLARGEAAARLDQLLRGRRG